MPTGPGARRAILVSTVSVLAGGAVALVGSLLLRVVMARALEPAGLGLVLLATDFGANEEGRARVVAATRKMSRAVWEAMIAP